jgi:hypothetical protein
MRRGAQPAMLQMAERSRAMFRTTPYQQATSRSGSRDDRQLPIGIAAMIIFLGAGLCWGMIAGVVVLLLHF